MNSKQKDIIKELRYMSKKLGHSPRKRDVSSKLSWLCYKHFGSFNIAKKKAKLDIANVRITKFPKDAFKIDKELAIITAYLTADGHLYGDLKGFYFSSKDKNFLKYLSKIIYNKFGLKGKYVKGDGYGESHKYLVFNKIVSTFLNNKGVPAGDKMLNIFDIPDWIKKSKKLSKEYLKIIFYCEGSKYKHSKNSNAIKINFNKTQELLDDALAFMESLKIELNKFNIKTTNSWISKSNKRRKDNKITKSICFKIKASSVNTFINKIGWLK